MGKRCRCFGPEKKITGPLLMGTRKKELNRGILNLRKRKKVFRGREVVPCLSQGKKWKNV